MSTAFELDTVNAADPAAFTAMVAPLFEGAPRFLDRLAGARPFADWASMFAAARAIVHAMPEDEQVELVDAHPRLGAPPATVSELSFREQGYDRDVPGDVGSQGADAKPARMPAAPRSAERAETEHARVAAELEHLNAAYEARFGFRYCVRVGGRSRVALLPDMAASLGGARDAELHRALDAVVDIAIDRLAGMLGPIR